MKRKISLCAPIGLIIGVCLLIVAARVLKPREESVPEPRAQHDIWPENKQQPENVKLTGPESHEAFIGESVTLDCHLEPQADVRERFDAVVVEWKFNNQDLVLVYRSRGFASYEQAEQFKDRVNPDDSWDISKGKLAVKIPLVTKADNGTYSCSVGHGSKRMQFSTQLNIKDSVVPSNAHNKAQDQTTQSHGQNTIADASVILVLAASTLLYSLFY
ncbi:uncharacterized protein LOC131989698 [Centropristis striata]|uniref:uncharacterized protein LOC131989698 n=1 Tax=Centropristis striata TaxID=184440 RepID=UPI0027E17371|nr:uncharacterized protein LOC131989698 [Centropristis striata]